MRKYVPEVTAVKVFLIGLFFLKEIIRISLKRYRFFSFLCLLFPQVECKVCVEGTSGFVCHLPLIIMF